MIVFRGRALSNGLTLNTNFSTSFSGTENPISEGGIWLNGLADGADWSNVQKTPGLAFGARLVDSGGVNRYADDIALLKTSYRAFSSDQYIQGTIYRASGYYNATDGHEIELLLRGAMSSGSATFYEILWGIATGGSQAYIAVVKWLGPLASYTAIYDPGAGSIALPTTGDVLYASITGTGTSARLTVKLNGSNVSGLSSFDVSVGGTVATYDSGQPGIGFWPTPGSTLSSYGFSSITAGDL